MKKATDDNKKSVTVTVKLKLVLLNGQSRLLDETITAYTLACNHVSSVAFETKELVQPKLHKLTYETLRSQYSMKSQMAQSAMKSVIARYRSLRSNGDDWNEVKFKKGEYDLVWNRDYSLFKDGIFSLNTINNGRIKVSFYKKAMEKYFEEN